MPNFLFPYYLSPNPALFYIVQCIPKYYPITVKPSLVIRPSLIVTPVKCSIMQTPPLLYSLPINTSDRTYQIHPSPPSHHPSPPLFQRQFDRLPICPTPSSLIFFIRTAVKIIRSIPNSPRALVLTSPPSSAPHPYRINQITVCQLRHLPNLQLFNMQTLPVHVPLPLTLSSEIRQNTRPDFPLQRLLHSLPIHGSRS